MKRVGILISGRGSNMMALVEQARGYAVVLVASDNPDAPGLAWAAARSIPTFASPRGTDRTAREDAFIQQFEQNGVQVIALAGYMRLLSPRFIDTVRGNIVNIHPSLLPLHKGLDTHARALAAGDSHGGCSVHHVTEEVDAGAVLGQTRVAVVPGDTPDTLAARVLVAEHALYPRILSEFVMTPIDRIRATALQLPEAEEQQDGSRTSFQVDGRPFARIDGPMLEVRADGEADGWATIDLAGDAVDWPLVEDRVARGWELTVPARLLEAGGR